KKYGLSRPDLSAKFPKRSASRFRARSMNVSWYCRMAYDCLMRVITVNVCGIRSAAAKGLFRWLRRQDADFVCLQETRSQEPHLARLRRRRRHYILGGDWNIAHRAIDLKNWRSNQKNSGFLPEERAWMDHLFSRGGYVDAFREVRPEPELYTWWSNRGRARANN